jgi:hypothetical protein
VQNAATVSRVERGGHIPSEAGRCFGIERSAVADAHREIGAGNVFHHHKAPWPVVRDVVDRDDVGMAQLANGLHLAAQALASEPRGRRRGHEQLDRHVAPDAPIPRPVDDRIPTATELARNLVAILEDRPGGEIRGFGHRTSGPED